MSRDPSVPASESSLQPPALVAPLHHAPNPFTSFSHQFRSPILAAFLGTSYSESADVGILCAVIFGVCLLFAIVFCLCRGTGTGVGRRSYDNRANRPRTLDNRNVYQQQHQAQPYVQQQYAVDNQGRIVQGRPHLQYDWQQWNARQAAPPPILPQQQQQHYQHNPFVPQAPPVYYTQNHAQNITSHPNYPPYSSNPSSTRSLVPESCLPMTDSGNSISSYSSNSATRPIPPPIRIPGGFQPYTGVDDHRVMPNATAPSYRALPHANTEKKILQEMHPKPSLMPVAHPVNELSKSHKSNNLGYDNNVPSKVDDAAIETSTSSNREPRTSDLRRSELGVLYPGQRNHHGEEQPRTLANWTRESN